jgi:F-type H+-transporting ATPase subunit delta
MISGLIPNRYAKALFKFAGDNGSQKLVYEEMKLLVEAFRVNPDMEKVLSNPYASDDDKRNLLTLAVGKKPSDDYKKFVSLILDHNREEFAYLMALAYRDIYRKENKIASVRITTAVKFTDAEIAKLKGVVEKSFSDQTFEYDLIIDPDIIGGFVIDVDSTRLDASISNELEQLRHNLLESV